MARLEAQPAAEIGLNASAVRIEVSNRGRSFDAAADATLLDAGLAAGLNLPHSCKGGHCGACRARLLAGAIDYPDGPPLGLSAAEVGESLILLCQAHARSDMRIETFEVVPAGETDIKRLPCRIERAERWSDDVMGVFLRLPAVERFAFEPGQYLDIMLSNGRRRSFSIASPPHDAQLLELHVRRVQGGELTDRLFAAEPRGTLLNIEGPLGQFVYRGAPSAPLRRTAAPLATASPAGLPPMLLIGGGTGLAPLKSIVRHVVERDLRRDMILYWGVRTQRDLYAHAALLELAARCQQLKYTPVLSAPELGWTGRRGFVHEAVLADVPDLAGFEIYASGPPAMIEAVQSGFPAHGMQASQLSFDSFDYAPVRQRTSAATRS